MTEEFKELLLSPGPSAIGNTRTLPYWSNSKRKRKKQPKNKTQLLRRQDRIVISKRVKSIK